MRKKPNLDARMERCSGLLVTEPGFRRGNWLSGADRYRSLELEVGCGKGGFAVGCAGSNPGTLLVAVELVREALVVAMELACEKGLDNLLFIHLNARELGEIFAPGEVSRIYLNFCDPWPKNRDAKHRLTSPFFLDLFWEILVPGSEIHFRTDNVPLFEYSLCRFKERGFSLKDLTRDLHAGGQVDVVTDYEKRYLSQGIPICRVAAVKPREERQEK